MPKPGSFAELRAVCDPGWPASIPLSECAASWWSRVYRACGSGGGVALHGGRHAGDLDPDPAGSRHGGPVTEYDPARLLDRQRHHRPHQTSRRRVRVGGAGGVKGVRSSRRRTYASAGLGTRCGHASESILDEGSQLIRTIPCQRGCPTPDRWLLARVTPCGACLYPSLAECGGVPTPLNGRLVCLDFVCRFSCWLLHPVW